MAPSHARCLFGAHTFKHMLEKILYAQAQILMVYLCTSVALDGLETVISAVKTLTSMGTLTRSCAAETQPAER